MSFADRSAGAFLGLSLGDAYGRPLEFLRGAHMRSLVVSTRKGELVWTDDTHMALYLAEAVLESGPDVLDADAFGLRVGEAFSRWLADPFMPGTAPGNTCLTGARRWLDTRDWKISGVKDSDGCGAVMRICPLGIALAGADLTLAARVSAMLTHAHPNAVESAIAASHLLRWTLEVGRFDAALVERALSLVGPNGTTAAALRAAIAEGGRAGVTLDESAIPEGDGGWRSPSALGLAVAAVLRGGTFEQIVDRAARIDGDSDSVACLAGMFAGAAGGTACLPASWVAAVHRSADIVDIAARLAKRGQPILAVADLHGHIGHFDALMAWSSELGAPDVVLLGDYCDNGPDIIGLIRRIISRPETTAIMGNHDLAALRAVGWPEESSTKHWFAKWNIRYGQTLASALGASNPADYAASLPADVRDWLVGRPWVALSDRYCFVHAGMESGALAPQVAELLAHQLPADIDHHPAPISNKALATTADPSWSHVVLSGHKNLHGSCAYVGPNRICLSAEVDTTGVLHAVVLPERRFVAVDRAGAIRDVNPD